MQIKRFSDGSFVAHRVTLVGSPRRFSIWFKADGTLTDAEAIDRTNRSFRPGAEQMARLHSKAKSLAAAHKEPADA